MEFKNFCVKTGVTGEMGHYPVAIKWHNIQFTVIFQVPAENGGVSNIILVGKRLSQILLGSTF